MTSPANIRRRGGCLGGAALLLFFLAASAPHRVHHFFEPARAADAVPHRHAGGHPAGEGHDHQPARQPVPDRTECAVLTTAQQAHAVSIAVFDLNIAEFSRREDRPVFFPGGFGFDPSPCAQRAPPRA